MKHKTRKSPQAGSREGARSRSGTVARRSGRPTLAEEAYQAIKSRILSLELHPGQFLTEGGLCELTGIGRMPVHQAVHRLQAEGLIEVIPQKGLVIRMDSLNDVLELLEARLSFEPNVAALAAERISKEQCAQLERLLERSRGLTSQSQRQAYGVIDRAFHGIIVEAAGNKILSDVLRPLQERSELFWRLRIMPEEGLEVTQREHEAVLHAILEHDAAGARRAMHAHLISLHNRILKASSSR